MTLPTIRPLRALALLFILPWMLALAPAAFAQKIWSGAGDGTTWADPLNWVGGAVPLPAEAVLLDNSVHAASYAVQLPAGAVTTTVARLTVQPGATRTITVTLPPANTGVPGLRTGDATPATDDLVLMNGATLVNASGAASGNGVEVNSLANGTVRIDNGAHYVHATARSTAGVVPLLSTAAGTDHGEFVYDSPGTGSVPIGASGRTYGSLTLRRTAGPATYTSSGASPLTVRGDLRVESGVTYTSSMTAAMSLTGDLVADGVVTLPAGQALVFTGTAGPQAASGAGPILLNGGGTVSASAAVSVANGARMALGGTLTNNGALSISGTLELRDGGALANSFPDWPSIGILAFNCTNAPYALGMGDVAWPAVGGPNTVEITSDGLELFITRTVDTVQLRGPVTNAANLTVNGLCVMEAGASLDASPVYGPNATLEYSLGDWTCDLEWVAGTTVGAGVPRNVTIDAGTGHTVSLPAADRAVPGSLTINSGTLVMNPAGGDLGVGEGFIVFNPEPQCFTPNGRTLILDGNLGDGDITVELAGSMGFDRVRIVDASVHCAIPSQGWIYFVGVPPGEASNLQMEGHSLLDLGGGTLQFQDSPCVLAVTDTGQVIQNGTVNVFTDLAITGINPVARGKVGPGSTPMSLIGRLAYLKNVLVYVDGLWVPAQLVLDPNGDCLFGEAEGDTTGLVTQVTLRNGGGFGGGPPHWRRHSRLVYGTGNHTSGIEWGNGDQLGPGVPESVTIDAGAGNTVTLPGDRYVPKHLVMASGDLDDGDHDLIVGRDLRSIWDGTDASSPLHHFGRTIFDPSHFGWNGIINSIVMEVPGGGSRDTLRFKKLELRDAQVRLEQVPSEDDTATVVELLGTQAGMNPFLSLQGNSTIDLGQRQLRFVGNPGVIDLPGGTTSIGNGRIDVDADLELMPLNGALIDLTTGSQDLLQIDHEVITHGCAELYGIMEMLDGYHFPDPPIYHDGSTLRYNTAGAATTEGEWSSVSGPGCPDNVVVTGGTNLVIDGSAHPTLKCRSDLTVGSGASLTADGLTLWMTGPMRVGGDLICDGSITMSSQPGADWFVGGSVSGSGSVAQNGRWLVLDANVNGFFDIYFDVAAVRIQKTGGALMSLSRDLAIAQSLDLVSGDIVTGSHKVVMAPGATVARTGGSVRGNLQKHIAPAPAPLAAGGSTMSPLALTFEVGSAAGYTPVEVNYDNVAAPGELTVSTTEGEHPDAATSGVDVTRDVNRYWTLTLDRAPDPSESYSAAFHWLPGDQDPGSDYGTYDVYEKAGAWSHQVATARTSDHTSAGPLTSYGEFVVGTPMGTTGVEVAASAEGAFLRMAGPNPFRGTTSMAFGLGRPGRVRIEIFSVTGQRVRTLMDADQVAGAGRTTWDGRDRDGSHVAPGMYVARMEAEGRRWNLPLCLVR